MTGSLELESLENLKIREFKINELFWVLHVSMYTDKPEVYVYQCAIIEDKHKRFVTPVQKTQLKDVLTFESKQEARLWFAINHPEEDLFEIDSRTFFGAYMNV